MCVLKHSKLLRLPVRKECFNTLGFFLCTRTQAIPEAARLFFRVLVGPRFRLH
jgi:hypothetical protein